MPTVYSVAQVLGAIEEFGDLVERFLQAKTDEERLIVVQDIRRETTINNVLGSALNNKQVANIIAISLDENRYFSR